MHKFFEKCPKSNQILGSVSKSAKVFQKTSKLFRFPDRILRYNNSLDVMEKYENFQFRL